MVFKLDKVRTWLAADQGRLEAEGTTLSRPRAIATLVSGASRSASTASSGSPRQVRTEQRNMHPNPLLLAMFDLVAIVMAISWMVRQW